MFLFRKRIAPPTNAGNPDDHRVWGGWTEGLLKQMSGKDSFDIRIHRFNVTTSQDAVTSAASVRAAQEEREIFEKFGSADDPQTGEPLSFPRGSGEPRDSFVQVSAELRGYVKYPEVPCDIEIYQELHLEIIDKESLGNFSFTSEDDLGSADETPLVVLQLWDADQTLLKALRSSFIASSFRNEAPSIRVFLGEKFEFSSDVKPTSGSLFWTKVRKVVTWEQWSYPSEKRAIQR